MNAFRYSPEMEKFLYDHFEEYNDKKMAEEFNRVFETEISWHQIRHFRRKHGIRGEHHQRHSEIFTDEIRAFIEANYKGTGYKDMALMIWHEFGKWYQPKQIRSYYRNHKLNSGLKGDLFQKGQKPRNGAKKGEWFAGCEKGWFKKGEKPPNYTPVGTEKIRPSNGYVWVKIAEPKKWRMKQLVVWEAAHGPIPKGMMIYFRDGDRTNCDLENLMLVERRLIGTLNRSGLSQYRGELTEAAINTARLQLAANDKRRNPNEPERLAKGQK